MVTAQIAHDLLEGSVRLAHFQAQTTRVCRVPEHISGGLGSGMPHHAS